MTIAHHLVLITLEGLIIHTHMNITNLTKIKRITAFAEIITKAKKQAAGIVVGILV